MEEQIKLEQGATYLQGFLAASEEAISQRGNPAVLVLHAWWGLNPTFKDFCRKLADEGYVAFAPDFYHGRIATTIEQANQFVDELTAEDAMQTIRNAAQYLLQLPSSFGAPLGVVGFSLGANMALNLPELFPDQTQAVVLYYGTGPVKFSKTQAAFLGHFAENDPFESPSDVDALEEKLRQVSPKVEFYRYPGTAHWFVEPDRPEYNPAAAGLAWQRTQAFLRAQLNP